MAKYRQIYIEFWQDGFVLDLTPEEKYFYLYLMTNSKATQCGIYELPKRIIETETGYNRESVEKFLKRFEEYGKIKYNDQNREIMVVNWIKYNWINSVKVLSLVDKELKSIKTEEFIKTFHTKCKEYGYRIDTLSVLDKYRIDQKKQKPDNDAGLIPYRYPIDSPSIDSGEEREREVEREEEREEEQEEEQEEEIENDDNFVVSSAIQFYMENIPEMNSFIQQDLLYFIDDFGDDMVIRAISKSLEQGKGTWAYAKKILNAWKRKGITTLQQVDNDDARFEEQKRKRQNVTPFKRQETVPDWFENRKNHQADNESSNVDQQEIEARFQRYLEEN